MAELFWMGIGFAIATFLFNQKFRDWVSKRLRKSKINQNCLICAYHTVIRDKDFCSFGNKLIKIDVEKDGLDCQYFTTQNKSIRID